MNYCPNCGTILKEHEDTCPNCGTKIIIEEVEEEMDLPKPDPKKKKTPPRKKKITQKRTKYKSQSVNVKEIPLTVKKAEKHQSADKDLQDYLINNREDVDKYYKKDEFVFNISSIIKIIAVVLLFILTVYVIFQTAIDNSKKQSVEVKEPILTNVNIFNKWESSNGGEFIFTEERDFYWYKAADDEQNYYSGVFTYKNGLDAVADMGYSDEDFKEIFGDDITPENVYSLQIIPNKAIINGQDETAKTLKPNTKWWYILIIRPDGTAAGYNKTLDVRYDLKVKTD